MLTRLTCCDQQIAVDIGFEVKSHTHDTYHCRMLLLCMSKFEHGIPV